MTEDGCKPLSTEAQFSSYNTSDQTSLVSGKSHRVSEKGARKLRCAAIIISWVSMVLSIFLAIAAIGFGVNFGIQSLFGFGLDSLLDSLSSMVILWRFYGQEIYSEAKEARACAAIGSLFIISALLLGGMSIQGLVVYDHPDQNNATIVFSVVSVGICLLLGIIKCVTGYKLESKAIIIDSVITLTGLVTAIYSLIFNSLYQSNNSLWYLDDLFGIIISVFLISYGVKIVITSIRDLQKLDKT